MKSVETKSDRKPLRRRWQTFPVLGRVLQLCKSVATFPQLLNHLHQTLPASLKSGGKMQTSPWLKINYSQSSPGACWLWRDDSERARVPAYEHVEVRAKPFTIMWVTFRMGKCVRTNPRCHSRLLRDRSPLRKGAPHGGLREQIGEGYGVEPFCLSRR